MLFLPEGERIIRQFISSAMLKGGGYMLLISFLLGSCTVERRMHRPGLSIQWHSIKKERKENVLTSDVTSKPSENKIETSTVQAAADISNHTYSEPEDFTVLSVNADDVQTSAFQAVPLSTYADNEDTTRVLSDEQVDPEEEDTFHSERSGKKYGWIYLLFMILFYAILGTILYFGALYPFYTGVILIVPLSILFGLEDRAGFLFGIISGMSYIGLFFLSGSVGFWGIFFLGFLALMLSLLLATYLDDVFDRGERKDDLPPPPPPPQMDPGDDW
jgi:hypothetical protein